MRVSEDVCETLRRILTDRPGERYLNALSGRTARERAAELARSPKNLEPGTIVALLGSGADGPRALRVSGEFGVALDGADRLAFPRSGEAPHERTDGDLLWRPIPLTGPAAPADVEHVVRSVGIVTVGGEFGKRDTEKARSFSMRA